MAIEAQGKAATGEAISQKPTRSTIPIQWRLLWGYPTLFGILGSVLLLSLYLGLVTLAQGFSHAAELLLQDWYLVVPIALGFGIQVSLFFYMRRVLQLRKGTGSATALAGAGTGTSSVAMLACCAHHVTDVLPLVGLSGAAMFLADYREPLMVLGIAVNLVGIVVMLRTIHRLQSCS